MGVLDEHARVPRFWGWARKSPYWPRFGGAFFCVGVRFLFCCARIRCPFLILALGPSPISADRSYDCEGSELSFP